MLANVDNPARQLQLPWLGWGYARYIRFKPIVEWMLAAVAVLLLLPILVIVWCVIKVSDPGHSAFFWQQRTGLHGRRFYMLKFRTMVVGAEGMEQSLSVHNMSNGPQFKMRNDPRITPVGGFLRRTHLDELPQLFNVLNGTMALVGPRPSSATPAQHPGWWNSRLLVKPGLTGPFQIDREANHNFSDRVRVDINYMRNLSLARDLHFIARTFVVAFWNRGGL